MLAKDRHKINLLKYIGDWENGIVRTSPKKLSYIFSRLKSWDEFEKEHPDEIHR